MKILKYSSFWLTLFSISICLFNLAGFDDKNLLLFLTSPILLFLEDYSSFFKRFISDLMLIWLFYFLNIFFWCYVGLIIDSIIHSSFRKKFTVYLIRIGIISCVIILISVIFYMFQNSETHISNILKNPDKYNEQSVQIAVIKSAKEGYGDKYIEEMATILQKKFSTDVSNSTITALGLIGTPHSIKVILENNTDPRVISHSLNMNQNAIISMLDINQTESMINSGIAAARLVRFTVFIKPLMNIKDNYPNKDIQEKAENVIQQINKNPQENHPKFYID